MNREADEDEPEQNRASSHCRDEEVVPRSESTGQILHHTADCAAFDATVADLRNDERHRHDIAPLW